VSEIAIAIDGRPAPMNVYPERLPECQCRENARRMVALHPELIYVEGWLVWTRPDPFEPHRLDHAWNETPDGEIVDATAWAYDNLRPFRYERADA
jgi:hypothetical protein